jgi:hypothetical protein
MISELLNFRDSLRTWGFEIEENCHYNLKSIPKGTHFVVHIGPEGVTKVRAADLSRLKEYKVDNFARTLLKFFPKKRLEKQIGATQRCFDTIIALANDLESTDRRLKALFTLSELLQDINPEAVIKALLDNEEVCQNESCYVAFEVDKPIDFGNGAIEQPCIDAINKVLLKRPTNDSSSLDFFGNPDTGWQEKRRVKAQYEIPIFAKNVDNGTLTRFGLQSSASCKIGDQTFREVDSILQFIMRPDNRAHYSKEADKDIAGICYTYAANDVSHIVFSTLMPKVPLLETDSDTTDEEWENALRNIIQIMKAQKLDNNSRLQGQVMVLRPTKGAWVMEYSRSVTGDLLLEKLQDWDRGINNGPQTQGDLSHADWLFTRPTIRQVFKSVNNRFTWDNRKGAFKPNECSSFSLQDIYEFFFDNPAMIQRMSNHIARYVIPMLLACQQRGGRPWDLRYLVPLCNLTLHKLNLSIDPKEKNSMQNHWAFCLGQVFYRANNIFFKSYKTRGMKVPDTRIGQKFIQMAYNNPSRAFAAFVRAFQSYHNWAESRGMIQYYQEWLNKIPATALPSVPSALDRQLLYQGYNYREPRKDDLPDHLDANPIGEHHHNVAE